MHRLLDLRTPKVYRGTSARSIAPEETWRRITPLLGPCGVTRLANITGLDHVGIPVYQAIRPNSRSLSVSQGKGIDRMGAKVSAAMEAIELHFAERPRCALRWATFAELQREGAVADPRELPRTRDFDVRRLLHWTQGFDLVARRSTWVPFDAVHINLTEPAGALLKTSNGLASGNTWVEAVFHGLCEVIERDAEALFNLRSAAAQAATLLDLGQIAHPAVRAMVERFAVAGITPLAWNATTDFGIPTVRLFLFDAHAEQVLNPVSAPYGAGCHIDRVAALLRALTEAAQTRLGWIAGSRDDLSRDSYRRWQSNTAELRPLLEAPKPARFEDLPTAETDSLEEDLLHVLTALCSQGIHQVIVVPLHDDRTPVAIARVIVPGLESTVGPQIQPGRRAQALL